MNIAVSHSEFQQSSSEPQRTRTQRHSSCRNTAKRLLTMSTCAKLREDAKCPHAGYDYADNLSDKTQLMICRGRPSSRMQFQTAVPTLLYWPCLAPAASTAPAATSEEDEKEREEEQQERQQQQKRLCSSKRNCLPVITYT